MKISRLFEAVFAWIYWFFQRLVEPTRLQEDRPYTREEIYQLLNVCDLRMRALVLLLASTGMRIGALPTLKVGDVVQSGSSQSPAKVTVYADSKDKYITFMSSAAN